MAMKIVRYQCLDVLLAVWQSCSGGGDDDDGDDGDDGQD